VADEIKALAPLEGDFKVVSPLVTPEEALLAVQRYRDLEKRLLRPTDYQTFIEKGVKRTFKKKSAWRVLGRFYGFSTEIVDERLVHNHNPGICARIRFPEVMKDEKDCGCPLKIARYQVKVTAPNGVYSYGVGLCSITEDRKFTRPDHDLASTAYTRAVNRAVSDLIGGGEDSAEDATSETGATLRATLNEGQRMAFARAYRDGTMLARDAVIEFLRDGYAKGLSEADAKDSKKVMYQFVTKGTSDDLEAVLAMLAPKPGEEFDPDAVKEDEGAERQA